MNARLVVCMLIAIFGGIGSAVAMLISGWGWIAAVCAYALGGALLLCIGATLASLPDRTARSARTRPASAYST